MARVATPKELARRGWVRIAGNVVTECEWDRALRLLVVQMTRGNQDAAVVAAALTSGPFARAMERSAA